MSALVRALVTLIIALSYGPAPCAEVQEHTLANGMKVLVKEDRRAPVVVCMVWYRAGSMDEVNGTTGVAHVLEHMMFKGTKSVAPGEFSRIIARAGGRDNAFTSRDSTVYHEQLHKSQLSLALRLEADRMANLLLSEEQFAREIKVVMEERRLRTDDQPKALVYEAFMATAYEVNPYRTPVIGWMTDLESMRVDDARDWHLRWYAPNNATLVVVGDVSAAEVFAEADKQFGSIAPRPLPPRKPQLEPAQRGDRRAWVKAPAEQPYLLMGWHVPGLRDVEKDWEPYALEMLAAVLAGSDAARLDRELVRESRLAVAANASYDGINRGPAMFILDATPAPSKTVQEVEQALRDQIKRIVEQGVSAEELRRVAAQVTAGQVFELDSMFSQARAIGSLDNAGLPFDSLDLQARKLKEVTAAQVQEVARKYLVDGNLTVAALDPQPMAGRKPAVPPPAEHVR
ncbi:MAG TPA: pitrilysin family protein [Burkholderiales bacterium]|nr:pitrilysin family protein [Burkholderiales bacterium]